MNDPPTGVLVATWYLFHPIESPDVVVEELRAPERYRGVKGLIIVAPEGVNGTIAGHPEDVHRLINWIGTRIQTDRIKPRMSYAIEAPMHRFKVLLRPEIVTLGAADVNPGMSAGEHVSVEDWNQVLRDPETLVIDTRNDYEVAIGTFEGAINPNTHTFREFVDWVHENDELLRTAPKVAMFCTGGVRCEKASAFMLNEGYEIVQQLKGGILAYLETTPESESAWLGQCFVFDERVSVGHGLKPGNLSRCRGCRHPLQMGDIHRSGFEEGVSCHRCVHTTTEAQKARYRERWKQVGLAAQKGEEHLGRNTGMLKKKLA